MAEITISIDDEGSEDRLRKLTVFLADLRSFWPLLVPVATGWWRKQFATEGDFGDQPWAPLSPGYAAAKELAYPGAGILVRTGAMRRAASNPRRSVTPTSLTLTIDDPKLQHHQEGDQLSNLPARPLIFGDPLPAAAAAELQDVAEVYITDLLRRI